MGVRGSVMFWRIGFDPIGRTHKRPAVSRVERPEHQNSKTLKPEPIHPKLLLTTHEPPSAYRGWVCHP